MNLVPAVWLFAALSALATALSWFLPACRKNYLPAKMTCSSLFLLTALLAAVSYGEVTDYSVYIIVALFFGLIGDFCLEYKQAKYFGYGVVAFAVGHLLYIYSFARLVQPVPEPNAILVAVFTLVILVLGFVMMKVEKIVFEGKTRLMYIYAAILISEFITGVIRGVTSIAAGNTVYGAFILAASALFITSDSFLALQLFGKPHIRRPEAVVLFTYFPAQTLFALSLLYQ